MLDIVASKIATAILGTVVGAAVRSVIPGQGAGVARGPRIPRLRSTRPTSVEEADIKQLAKHVEKGLDAYLRHELREIAENEKQSALELAGDSFGNAKVDIWECALDSQLYATEVLRQSTKIRKSAALSSSADAFYEILVYRISLQVVQFISTWPTFSARVDIDLLKRMKLLAEAVEKIQDRLGQDLRAADVEFEARYCSLVEESLDHLQIFGLDLAERSNRSYSLTTAYITLSVSPAQGTNSQNPDLFRESMGNDDELSGSVGKAGSSLAPAGMKAENAISSLKRILLRGDAGSGKTTLLQWLSVNVARRSLEGELAQWNTLVPFILPLRRFANKQLPSPAEFFPEVGTHLADEMPDKWVSRILRTGRALVLIDGVDELPSNQREEARKWLRDLIRTYPSAHYFVTSRPAAAESGWLSQDEFATLDMLPMSSKDVENFVQHWHDAARAAENDAAEITSLNQGQIDLIGSIKEERQLKRLASNPLLCALLCTLNRDRHSQLPKDRMELYRAALDMLLLRRDRERRIEYPEPPNISDSQKKSILGGFAYWLIRNGLTDSAQEQAVNQVFISLESMPSVVASPDEVFDYLLVRSGCLRRPVPGRVDFVHRTFQEFLAAARIVEVDDLEALVTNAHLDQWHEVVVMAVGHARPKERSWILSRLLERGEKELAYRSQLHLLAAACLETAGECDPEVHERVKKAMARLIPPRTMADAKEIASAGEMVIPLIPERRLAAVEAAATIRMASIIGGDGALSLVSRFALDKRLKVRREIERAWQYFEAEEYAERVLGQNHEAWKEITIGVPEILSAVRHLPNLEQLDVFCSADSMDWLPESSRLQSLVLRRAVTNFSFDSVRKCPNLSRLVITAFTASGSVEALGDLTHLQEFAAFVSEGLHLSRIPKMESLTSFQFHGEGHVDVANIASACRNLKELTLGPYSVPDFSNLQEMEKLERLSVWHFDPELYRALSLASGLHHLTIRGRFESCDLGKLAEFNNLRHLSVRPVGGFSGEIDVSPFMDKSRFTLSLSLGPDGSVTGVRESKALKHEITSGLESDVRIVNVSLTGDLHSPSS
ncbi:NACHT domain-containing protein [Streptomyces sp. NPDC048462]|uniref:NACHT domain-containing protein n=1 Tax=Streptomyces sp. NPDC048462 TaxID=3365555 RepID=UPI00370FC242